MTKKKPEDLKGFNSKEPCPECGGREYIGIEYWYTSPQRYDGISEWQCQQCKARFGRWTGKKLAKGELEKKYGGVK